MTADERTALIAQLAMEYYVQRRIATPYPPGFANGEAFIEHCVKVARQIVTRSTEPDLSSFDDES